MSWDEARAQSGAGLGDGVGSVAKKLKFGEEVNLNFHPCVLNDKEDMVRKKDKP